MNTFSKLFLTGVIAATIIIGCKDDSNDNTPSISDSDKNFATNASMANRSEIDVGQLAADHGDNSEVRNFGTRMVSEHTPALKSLDSIGNLKGITMPTLPDAEHQQLKQRLSNLTGINFDTAYVNSQVKDHKKVISMFEDEASNGQDSDLKAYANKNLPHLRDHLSAAQQLQTTLMNGGNNNDTTANPNIGRQGH
jgi:putative membrane protein